MDLNEYAKQAHETACSKGFWDEPGAVHGEKQNANDPTIVLAKLALIKSPVSTAPWAGSRGPRSPTA